MPPNPFSRDPAVNVAVGADTEGFNQGIESATDKLGSLKNAAGAAGVAIGALGVGAMAKSVQVAADFEEAMVEVEKVTSPETARKMGDRIQEMAETIPMAQSELATLAADAGRFGIEGPKAIENFTETAAKMAEATNLSSNEAGESLAKLSELTNTPIDQMENLGSSVNSLSNNFATSSQEIVDSMLRASGSLSQLGLNQREIAGLTASLNEVSESSERAGTRLRRVGQELLDPKKAGEVANALGMTAEEFTTMRDESPVKLIRQMATVMGEGGEQANMLRGTLSTTSRQALSGLSQNLDGVAQAQDLANRSFEEGTSLQEEFDTATDTFNARLRIFRNRLNKIAIETGTALLPALNNLLDSVTPLVEDFSTLNEKTDGLAGKAAIATAGVAGLAGVLFAVGGPAGVAAGAIFGAAGAAAFLGNKFLDLKPLINDVQKAFGDLASNITGHLTGKNGIVTNTRSAIRTLQTAWRIFGDDIMKIVDGSFAAVKLSINTVTNAIASTINVWLDLLSGDFDGALQTIETFWTDTFSSIADFVTGPGLTALGGAFGLVTKIITGYWRGVKNTIIGAGGIVKSTISGVASYITSTAKSMLESAFATAVVGIKNGLSYLLGSGKGTLKWDVLRGINFLVGTGEGTLAGIIVSSLSSSLSAVMQPVKNAFSYLTGTGEGTLTGDIKAGVDYLIGTGDGTLIGDIKDTIGDINTYLIGTGDELIDRAIGGVASTIENGLSYLTGTGDGTLIGDIKAALGDAGDVIGEGIKVAINAALGLPKEFVIGKVVNPTTGNTILQGQTLTIPALAEGGIIEESGLAFVDEGERFSGAPGAPGAEVDQSGGMMLSGTELRNAVAEGVTQAAQEGAFGGEEIARAIEDGMGETTVEFRDQDRYRAVRR